MPYVIAEPCVDVKSGECVDVCPVACIHTTPDSAQNYIDPDVCIECEQCVVVCPVEAIFVDSELPDKWQLYIDINAAFFRRNKAAPQPIPVTKALQMVQAVHGYASQVGIAVSAAVVDGAGHPIAVGRMDEADPLTAELALNKAYTAASFQIPSHQLFEQARRAWFWSMIVASKGRFVAAGGAFPVVDADGIALLGAIGVAGNGTPEQDVLCCRVGLSVLEGSPH